MLVGRIDLGDHVGGECLFIPSKASDDVLGGVGEEDDGFLVTFVSPKDGGNSGKQAAADNNDRMGFDPAGGGRGRFRGFLI